MNDPTADRWVSPVFVAGELCFRVDAEVELGPSVLTAFEGLATTDDRDATATFLIRQAGADESAWQLVGPNCWGRAYSGRHSLLDALVTAVNLSALDADPDALHLHAAAVSREGEAVLVVGESGSGKTTLAATLASAGWSYITDEMVRLTVDADMITGFSKPLSVRSSGIDLLPQTPVVGDISGASVSSVQLSPLQLGVSTVDRAHPRLLLLCSTQASERRGTDPEAREISAADAVVRIMAQTMDAGRFGSRTLEVLGWLAASCRCFEFEVGEPERMVSLISRLLDESDDPSTVEVPSMGDGVAEGVATVFIGDRAVVHHGGTGLVLALDAPASAVWRQLGGLEPSGGPVDLGGPVVSGFVAKLSSLGLLSGH